MYWYGTLVIEDNAEGAKNLLIGLLAENAFESIPPEKWQPRFRRMTVNEKNDVLCAQRRVGATVEEIVLSKFDGWMSSTSPWRVEIQFAVSREIGDVAPTLRETLLYTLGPTVRDDELEELKFLWNAPVESYHHGGIHFSVSLVNVKNATLVQQLQDNGLVLLERSPLGSRSGDFSGTFWQKPGSSIWINVKPDPKPPEQRSGVRFYVSSQRKRT